MSDDNKNRISIINPSIDHMDTFLSLVKKSNGLHHPWVYPPNNKEQYLAYINRSNTPNQFGYFLQLKTSKDIIGVINIGEIVKGCFQSGYLGFYIFERYQAQGLMHEGLNIVISHAFSALKLHRLEANIQPSNAKSIALVKKLGFKQEGFSPQYLFINNAWQDHNRYALIAKEN